MIDNIGLYINTTLPKEIYHTWDSWGKYEEEGITKFKGYTYKYKSIYIKYFTKQSKLRLEGRIIDLLPESKKIDNIDCLWIGTDNSHDLHNVVPIINNAIFELTGLTTNILDWKVSKIEICYNIHTAFVNQYIELFNIISEKRNGIINYAKEKNVSGSCYLKTKGQFQDNKKKNFIINFYNKYEQLISKNAKKSDIEAAKNILRLEIQAHYHLLKRICKRYGIDNATRPFGQFLDISLCKNIILDLYEEKITDPFLHFFNEEAVYMQLHNYGIAITEKLQEYITAIAKNHSISSYKHKTYGKILRGVGINTDCFIPGDWGIHVLKSPVSLLREVIKQIIDDRLDYQENNGISKFDKKNQIQLIDFRRNPDPRLKTPNEAWGKDWWKKWVKE